MPAIEVNTDKLYSLKTKMDLALNSIDSDGNYSMEVPSIGPLSLDNAAINFHSDSESAFRSAKRDIGLIGEAIVDIAANFENTDTECAADLAEQNAENAQNPQSSSMPGDGQPV
ncbi:hypothetical protein [Nocardiopsis valliformis]|uniref:hypothetical protein n=1 Tax=Nocardiopsis valliformis TaxID=239974 RepID=UPI00034ACD36|nr:hypothetical protein [Nocardiopsis valliformis]